MLEMRGRPNLLLLGSSDALELIAAI